MLFRSLIILSHVGFSGPFCAIIGRFTIFCLMLEVGKGIIRSLVLLSTATGWLSFLHLFACKVETRQSLIATKNTATKNSPGDAVFWSDPVERLVIRL